MSFKEVQIGGEEGEVVLVKAYDPASNKEHLLQYRMFDPGVAGALSGLLTSRRIYLLEQLAVADTPQAITRMQGQIAEIDLHLAAVKPKNWESQRTAAQAERTQRTPEY